MNFDNRNGFKITRKSTKKVRVGEKFIGEDAPITVQSMTNTDTGDINKTVEQIRRLEEAGCDIVRVAVPDNEAALALKQIKKDVKIPIVADIHFDYRLAISSMENGADKIRINPGNIGGEERIRQVVETAKSMDIPIRIGINSGSVEKDIIDRYGGITPEGMVESALRNVEILEKYKFNNIVISIKASNVPMTIAAYKLVSQKSNYPLHIGVTEAGTVFGGTIKSAVALGCLLAEGIGDTLRISLTGNPVEEVKVGREILKALEIKKEGIEIISCPTCGRCRINLIPIVNAIESAIEVRLNSNRRLNDKLSDRLSNSKKNIKIAVMGCAVNGPGEAKEADIGIAGGKGEAILFKKGKIIRKIPQEQIVDELLKEIENII